MLYYVFSDSNKKHQWHVGHSTSAINDYTKSCVYILADGDELEAIRRQFSNVPISNNRRVVRWKGAMAEFIALNLQS